MLTRSEPDVMQPLRPNSEFVATGVQDIIEKKDISPTSIRQPVAQGFSQMVGLHACAAMLTILVDAMVFTGDLVSVGSLLPLSIGVAVILGFIVYKIQRKWYGDDHDGALIKALIVALLTAIPVPLGPFITVPSGIIGTVNIVRRKMK